ncbi:phosphonate metabolism transcriptional regulator PhnF [Xaviernesmea oryzae]|nr:GntR family transcriptional regulator, phosphonate transport system regulatory protein [Xaviernesmea oryzae]
MMPKDGIDRGSGVALWRQIADRLRQAIVDGEFGTDGLMPGEMALSARFAVNRHTVRAALAGLVEEGLIETVQGRGTRVRPPKRYSFPISKRTRFSEGLAGQIRERQVTVIEDGVLAAPQTVAEKLGLAEGHPVLRLVLVSRVDGVALSNSTNYFDAQRFAAMAERVRETGSITRAYRDLGVEDYIRRATELTARLADERERGLLDLKPGAVVMEARALNATPEGAPLQYAVTAFAADRVTLRLGDPIE